MIVSNFSKQNSCRVLFIILFLSPFLVLLIFRFVSVTVDLTVQVRFLPKAKHGQIIPVCWQFEFGQFFCIFVFLNQHQRFGQFRYFFVIVVIAHCPPLSDHHCVATRVWPPLCGQQGVAKSVCPKQCVLKILFDSASPVYRAVGVWCWYVLRSLSTFEQN